MTDDLKERLRELKNVGGFDDAVTGDHCRGMWVEDALHIEALACIDEAAGILKRIADGDSEGTLMQEVRLWLDQYDPDWSNVVRVKP